MENIPNPLDLIATKDLIEHIIQRFDHVVIAGVRVNVDGRGSQQMTRRWKGNHVACAGLAAQVMAVVNEAQFREEEPTENME